MMVSMLLGLTLGSELMFKLKLLYGLAICMALSSCYYANPVRSFEQYLLKNGRPLVKVIKSPIDGNIHTTIQVDGKNYYNTSPKEVLTPKEQILAVYYYSSDFEIENKSHKGNYQNELHKFLSERR